MLFTTMTVDPSGGQSLSCSAVFSSLNSGTGAIEKGPWHLVFPKPLYIGHIMNSVVLYVGTCKGVDFSPDCHHMVVLLRQINVI